MKRLFILIEAPDEREVQEALDDAVAVVAAGQQAGEQREENVRIVFRWDDPDMSRA